jgi:hypothetical protein
LTPGEQTPTKLKRECHQSAVTGPRRPIRTLLTLALLLGVAIPAIGQDDDLPLQLWLAFQHHHKVGERFRVSGKLGYKELTSPDRYFGEWNKSYINGDGSYDLGEHFRIDGGVGLYYTYQPEDEDTFEFRLWQGATAFWPDIPGVRRLVFTHRLRLEERFTDIGGGEFAMRLRYRLDTKIPINKHTVEPGAFYLPLAAEFFADLTGEVTEFFGDESRLSVGLGYVMSKNWTFDLRFQQQRSRSTGEEDFTRSGNVIDFMVKSSFGIRDLIKGR